MHYELAFGRTPTAPLKLRPIGSRTTATSTRWATDGGFIGRAAAPAVPLLVVSSVLVAFFPFREPGGAR